MVFPRHVRLDLTGQDVQHFIQNYQTHKSSKERQLFKDYVTQMYTDFSTQSRLSPGSIKDLTDDEFKKLKDIFEVYKSYLTDPAGNKVHKVDIDSLFILHKLSKISSRIEDLSDKVESLEGRKNLNLEKLRRLKKECQDLKREMTRLVKEFKDDLIDIKIRYDERKEKSGVDPRSLEAEQGHITMLQGRYQGYQKDLIEISQTIDNLDQLISEIQA